MYDPLLKILQKWLASCTLQKVPVSSCHAISARIWLDQKLSIAVISGPELPSPHFPAWALSCWKNTNFLLDEWLQKGLNIMLDIWSSDQCFFHKHQRWVRVVNCGTLMPLWRIEPIFCSWIHFERSHSLIYFVCANYNLVWKQKLQLLLKT